MMVLPAIQVNYFVDKRLLKTPTTRKHQTAPLPDNNHVIFELQNGKHRLYATATLLNNKRLLVHKGSIVRGRWAGSKIHNYKKLHDTMLEQGIIQECSGQWIFMQDYDFPSPSAAGAMVMGNASAPKFWKLKGTNTTYAEWEAAQLDQMEPE